MLGTIVGGITLLCIGACIGVTLTCCCVMSGRESRREEERKKEQCLTAKNGV